MATQFSSPRQQTLENSLLHHLGRTGAFHFGQPIGAIRPDLAPDDQNRVSNSIGDRIPGWDVAQRNSRAVHRHAGRPLEPPLDYGAG